jgi:transposase
MSNITRVGVDLAQNVFQVHAVDASGNVVTNRMLKRDRFLAWCCDLPPGCLVAIGKPAVAPIIGVGNSAIEAWTPG